MRIVPAPALTEGGAVARQKGVRVSDKGKEDEKDGTAHESGTKHKRNEQVSVQAHVLFVHMSEHTDGGALRAVRTSIVGALVH